MSTAQPPTATSVYPDRSERLLLLGIFQVVLGCLCGLMGAVMVGAAMLGPMGAVPQGQSTSLQMMIPALVFYVLLAVALIWLGIGLVRARRWAWTLTVVLSWMWLVIRVVSFVAFVFLIGPMIWESMARDGKVPREMIMGMLMVMGLFVVCVYILLPGLFLVVCHRESVRATCQTRDPKIRWTDRCPMPVLALTVIQALGAVAMPSALAYGSVIVLFGVFLSRASGTVAIGLIMLVLAYLAWGSYRLQMAAWWGMLLAGMVGALNTVVTFSRTDLMQMYEKMGFPPEQLEMMRKTGIVELMSRWGPWMSLVGGAAWLGYLLYVRRYFIHSDEQTTETW